MASNTTSLSNNIVNAQNKYCLSYNKLCLRPFRAAAERSYPASEVRDGGREELPHAPTPEARGGGQEELPRV